MATYNIPQGTRSANVETVSPAVTVPSTLSEITIQLTSSQWATKTGSITWGVQRCDDGANWYWWIYTPSPGADPLQIGTTFRGKLPSITVTSDWLVPAAGAQVRLFVIPTVDIRLGATITTVE